VTDIIETNSSPEEGKREKRKREDDKSQCLDVQRDSESNLDEPETKKPKSTSETNKIKKKATKSSNENNDVSGSDNCAEKPKKKGSAWGKPKLLSPALAHFLQENFQITADSLPRSEVVRKLHEYIKAKNLQDPKDRRRIIFDETLRNVFKTSRTTYFKINTLLTRHLADPRDLL
jgi:upstream activation factor subunit UAF30